MDIKHRCRERKCKFYKGINPYVNKHYCVAFHEGIPEDILCGDDDHLTIREGQSKPVCFSLPDRNIVKPYPLKEMESCRGWGRDNLCATIHNIYMMSDDQEIKYWCRMAVKMTKNMAFALMDYRQMLIENGIGIAHATGIQHDGMLEWQRRGRSLYRGKNPPDNKGY